MVCQFSQFQSSLELHRASKCSFALATIYLSADHGAMLYLEALWQVKSSSRTSLTATSSAV
jgi:hypothetical protein